MALYRCTSGGCESVKVYDSFSDDIDNLFTFTFNPNSWEYIDSGKRIICPQGWGTSSITLNLTALHDESVLMGFILQAGQGGLGGTFSLYINEVLKHSLTYTNKNDYFAPFRGVVDVKKNDVIKIVLTCNKNTQLYTGLNYGAYKND
jgi:hypothetical protein